MENKGNTSFENQYNIKQNQLLGNGIEYQAWEMIVRNQICEKSPAIKPYAIVDTSEITEHTRTSRISLQNEFDELMVDDENMKSDRKKFGNFEEHTR